MILTSPLPSATSQSVSLQLAKSYRLAVELYSVYNAQRCPVDRVSEMKSVPSLPLIKSCALTQN